MQGGMENQQAWRSRLSFRNATILVCFFNLIAVLLLLHGFIGVSNRRISGDQPDPEQLRYVIEAEAVRRAMEPLELIKRVKEIQQEASTNAEILVQQKSPKQTAAVDLSKRLQDFRAMNDAQSKKALEEWRKRKMERERQREMEKNGTISTAHT